jgi:hypothetical protein
MSTENPLYEAIQGTTVRGSRRTEAPPGERFAPPTAAWLVQLIADAGVTGAAAELYIARRFRYYLGKTAPAVAPAALRTQRAPSGEPLTDWLDRRAWQVLEDNHHHLPAIFYDRMPRSAQ